MKIDKGFVLTCVDKEISLQHQKLSWFWKKVCRLRFSWCKVYGERASIWNRRCWWQTTQEKNMTTEEEGIGLQKCSLVNITKNGVEEEWPSSSFFLLVGGVHQGTCSFSLFSLFSFFHFIFELFYNEYLLLFVFYSSYSSFSFLVFFTSCLEVFTTKHPLSLLFFFIILMKKWRKEKKKKKISEKKEKKERGRRNKRRSLVNTSKNEVKKRIILFLFLLEGGHQQASSFSVFLHYNEYLLFTLFSSSYSSYFLFFFHFLFGGVIILFFLSSLFFTSLHFWRINIFHLLFFFFPCLSKSNVRFCIHPLYPSIEDLFIK